MMKHWLSRRSLATKFTDRVVIHAFGGRGGDGCASHEGRAVGKQTPNGGPGGRGGDVILVAKDNLRDFSHINSYHLRAENGKHGSGQGKSGKRGSNMVVGVPCGTTVYRGSPPTLYDDDGEPLPRTTRSERDIIAELNAPQDEFVIAKGGLPGKGNLQLSTLTYRRVAPLRAQERLGQLGTSQTAELRLKTIADAALVGYPNAGKSSLLGRLSRSRPKVASYPFTTLYPFVGFVEFSDAHTLTIADLPGLVDGASLNRGMGHEFLQHIERTKLLIFVIDGASEAHERKDSETVTPTDDLDNLIFELDQYLPGLASRPSLVVINKLDREKAAAWFQDSEARSALEQVLPESCYGVIGVSTTSGVGLEQLVTQVRLALEEINQANDQEENEWVNEDESPPPPQFKELKRVVKNMTNRRQLLHKIKLREAMNQDQPDRNPVNVSKRKKRKFTSQR